MEDQSLFNSSQPQNISEGLQNFINAMVEEIVLEGKPFNTQKKYLKKFSEMEGLNYEHLEDNICTFIEIFENIKKTPNVLMEKYAVEKGNDCYLSDSRVMDLLNRLPQNARFVITDSKTAKHGFIDFAGNVVIEPQYDEVRAFHDGLAAVRKGNKWGVINRDGEEAVPFVYESVGDFSEGMAVVKRSSKWGFIDKTGKEVIPCKYRSDWHHYTCFSEGLAAVVVNHKFGYVDKIGNEVIPCVYDSAEKFSEGLACVQLANGRSTVIEKKGREVIDFRYDCWSSDSGAYSDGFLGVAIEDASGLKWGFIDREGREVVPCKYDQIEDFHEGMAMVAKNGKTGFVDVYGNEVVPCIYNSFFNRFSEGLASVQDDNYRFGYIDKKGNIVIPFRFSSAEDFREGLAAVELDDKWMFIDKTGKEVFPCDPYYHNDEHTAWDTPFFDKGLAKVSIEGKMAYIDKTGRVVWVSGI